MGELYATHLSQLQEMGFFDTEENIRALGATARDVYAAMEPLLEYLGQWVCHASLSLESGNRCQNKKKENVDKHAIAIAIAVDKLKVTANFQTHFHTVGPGHELASHKKKPRKRRSRTIALGGHPSSALDLIPPYASPAKPRKYSGRRPDPDAPKITRPCSECGKTFWSWKALFGHMRCHPERQWRGMNPPLNFPQPARPPPEADPGPSSASVMTEEEHEVAACLLMLANNGRLSGQIISHNTASLFFHEVTESYPGRRPPSEYSGHCTAMEDTGHDHQYHHHHHLVQGHFECSSCKKVFGSHQALGGHRASHKNVKGCFANAAMMKGSSLGFYDHNNHNNNNTGVVISTDTTQRSDQLGESDDSDNAAAAAADRPFTNPLAKMEQTYYINII
ncbi:hypothetical protein SAY86_001212 [Trapa natans]|uniref:Uncharacterized protein n=1 Tax=Trapa natans TaxID=22666 RepID=A0AAN7MD85_TRANT|nr:hypothetical protein SAY86_001212 [Trapa natans]